MRQQVQQTKLDKQFAWVNNQQDWEDVYGLGPEAAFGVFGAVRYFVVTDVRVWDTLGWFLTGTRVTLPLAFALALILAPWWLRLLVRLTLILVVLATVTFIFLPGIKDPPNSKADGLEVAEGDPGARDAELVEVAQLGAAPLGRPQL